MYCKSTGKSIIGAFAKEGTRLKFKVIATSDATAQFVLDSPIFSDGRVSGFHMVYVSDVKDMPCTKTVDASTIYSGLSGNIILHSLTDNINNFANGFYIQKPNTFRRNDTYKRGAILTNKSVQLLVLFKLDISKCTDDDYLVLTHNDKPIAMLSAVKSLVADSKILSIGGNMYVSTTALGTGLSPDLGSDTIFKMPAMSIIRKNGSDVTDVSDTVGFEFHDVAAHTVSSDNPFK